MSQSRPVTSGAQYSRLRPRKGRLVQHGVPLLVAAGVAFAAGAVVGGDHRPAAQRLADDFVAAWARGDMRAMHGMLSEDVRSANRLESFTDAYARAAATATLVGIRARDAKRPEGDTVEVPIVARTKIFGTVSRPLRLPIVEEGGEPKIAWGRHLTFPGVPREERLSRRTQLPTRATLLAADGTVLAQGPDRSSEDPALAASISGQMGPIPEERARELRAEGVPNGALVGLSGLELALDDELRGRPGGVLRAGDTILARSVASPSDPVRSTIVPRAQRAAVQAVGGRLGGAVAVHPRTGAVLAAAGIGLSGLQPPGSTFKIVTLAGALQAKITSPNRRYPVETFTTIEGVRLENANGESCGGTLLESFAHSCNSVFAPLGTRLGAERLVRAAEAFGFNKPPGIDGAATSTIPQPDEIGDRLAVGASAIGQGRVQATALQMAIVAATIANRGERPVPTLLDGTRSRRVRAIPARTARTLRRAMRGVVEFGTGTAAAIPGVSVAGKTGTAELRTTQGDEVPAGDEGTLTPDPAPDPTATDAWFAAFAPAGTPRVAVGVLLVESGVGGETAAPAARILLSETLRRRG